VSGVQFPPSVPSSKRKPLLNKQGLRRFSSVPAVTGHQGIAESMVYLQKKHHA
jgi:hypothetical protein